MKRVVALGAIVLVVLAGCVVCNRDDFGEPIPVPTHPAFILRSVMDEDRITVVDLDEEKIIGYRQVVDGQYVVEDFAVSPDNLIFLPVSWFEIAVDGGKCVLAVDVTKDNPVVDSIPTSVVSCDIHPFAGGTKAFVAHSIMLWGDTDVVATEIDFLNPRVIDTFRFSGILDNVLSFSDGNTYLLYTDWNSDSLLIQQFDAENDSLVGKPIYIDAPLASLLFAEVIDEAHFCAPTNNGQGYDTPPDAIAIFNLSGNQTAVIPVGEDVWRLFCHDNKLYVCHNTGGLMKHGNHNKVSVIDLESKSVIKTIEVCNAPVDIAYSAATNKIVVVSGVGTVITFIDPETDSVTNTLVSDEVGDVDEWGYLRLRIPE